MSRPRIIGPVKVLDQSETPPRVVDEGGPTDIASKWIPKAIGTPSFIEQLPGPARGCYVATTREGVEEAWRSHPSNRGKGFPAHRVEKTPDGCHGLFNISAAHLVDAFNRATKKEEYRHFQLEGVER